MISKVGLACGKPDSISFDEWFKIFKANNMDVMELGMYKADTEMDFEYIKKCSEKYGVEIWSVHMPFYPFEKIELSSTDEDVRLHTVEVFKEIIKKASPVGINKFVIHPSGEPIDDDVRYSKLEACKKSLNCLAEFAGKYNGVICVEDLPRTCLGKNSDEILELLSINDNLRACFDTNHLLGENNVDFIKKIGKKIATLHISDYDFEDERHWIPGEGKIDWKSLYNTLLEIGYDGAWVYEIAFSEEMIKKLRKNAENIFAGNI